MELLIVVVILAVLSAIVVPQLSNTAGDAKLAVLDSNLAGLRSAISRYYHEHGHYPGAVRSDGSCAVGTNSENVTPGAAALVAHLTQYTTRSGIACTGSNANTGGAIKYGPYMREIPANPMTGDNTIVAIKTGVLDMSGSGSDQDGGWLYDFVTGRIIADQPTFGAR